MQVWCNEVLFGIKAHTIIAKQLQFVHDNKFVDIHYVVLVGLSANIL